MCNVSGLLWMQGMLVYSTPPCTSRVKQSVLCICSWVIAVCLSLLASFPGVPTSSLWSSSCSMPLQRGKAWEIWSHAVTWGRQRADTWRVVPDEESESSCSVISRARGQEHLQGSINNIHHLRRQGQVDVKQKLYSLAPPPMCLPSVYVTLPYMNPCVYRLSMWHYHTWLNLPSLFPLYWHAASNLNPLTAAWDLTLYLGRWLCTSVITKWWI